MTVFEPSALPSLDAATPENPWKKNSSPAAPSTRVDGPSTAVIDFDEASWPALSSLSAAQVPPPPRPSPSSVQQPSSPPPLLPTPVQPSSPAPETATAPPAPDTGAVRPPAAHRNPPQWRVRGQQHQRWAPNPRPAGSRHPPDAGDLFRRESSQFYYNQGYMNGFTAPPEWRYRPSFGVPEMPPPTNWPPPSADGPSFPPPYGGNAGAPLYWPPYHSPYPGGNAGAPPYRPPHHSPYGGGHANAPPYWPPYVDYHHYSFYPGLYGGEFQIPNGYPMPPPQPVQFHHQMNHWSDSSWNQQNRWRNAVPQSSNNHSGQDRLDCQDNEAGTQHQKGQQDPNGQSETPKTRVRKQIEYYFCDQNLENDDYLKKIMDAEGWVDVHKIANFRRVRRITGDISLVREAMQSSDSVELQDDKLRKRSGWEKYILTGMQNLQLDE